MIQDFINQATSQLGISTQSAQQATGGILGMLQKNAEPSQFQQLLGKVPGADQLLNQFGHMGQQAPAPSGGGLGGLMGMASGLLGKQGGGLGEAAGLVGMLSNSGISADKGMNFAGMLMGFLKQKAGADVLGGVLKNVPALAKLVG